MEEEIINHVAEEEMKDVEVETIAFSLDDDEVEELIEKLNGLKETKNFTFEMDEENELEVTYDEPSDDEENEENEDDSEELSDDENEEEDAKEEDVVEEVSD